MGMSIEECINQVECCRDHQYRDFDKDRISLNIAIDTMRKYQKIEEIVKRYEHPDKEEIDKFYWDIIGVIEDGND